MSDPKHAEEILIQINGQLQQLYQAGDYASIEAISVAVDEQVSGGRRDVPNILSRILNKLDQLEERQRRRGQPVPNGWQAAATSQAWRSEDQGGILLLRAFKIQAGVWKWRVEPGWTDRAFLRTIQIVNPPFGLRLKEMRVGNVSVIDTDSYGAPAGVFRQEFRLRNSIPVFDHAHPLEFIFAYDGAAEHVGEDVPLVMWVEAPEEQWGGQGGVRGPGTPGMR